jgi:hypothetical protein
MSQQINLYNPLFREKGFSPTSANSMLYGVGIAVLCTAAYGVYQDNRTRGVARSAQEVAQQVTEFTESRDKLMAQLDLQKPNAELAAELGQLEVRLRGRQDIVEALNSGAVGTTSGFSGFMQAFSRQTVNGLWLTGFDIASSGNEFRIDGRTLSADLLPVYLTRLNAEKSLQGRQFAALRISQPEVVAGAAPAPAVEAKAPADPRPEDAAKDAAAAKPATPVAPAPPRYLEFTISSSEPADAAQKQAAPALAPAPTVPLQAQSGPSTAAVLDAAMRASTGPGKAEAAK